MRDSAVGLRGRFIVECFDKERVLWREELRNGITNEGLHAMLDIMFRNATQVATWYVAPLTLVTGVSADDTLGSHSGWTEVTSAYDESTRQAWSPPAASGKKLRNTTAIVFTMNADTLVDGFLVASDSTKGGTSGTLWCTGLFTSGQKSFGSGRNCRIIYELTASAL